MTVLETFHWCQKKMKTKRRTIPHNENGKNDLALGHMGCSCGLCALTTHTHTHTHPQSEKKDRFRIELSRLNDY